MRFYYKTTCCCCFLGGKCNYFDCSAIKQVQPFLSLSLSLSGQPPAKHIIKWSQGQHGFRTEVGVREGGGAGLLRGR